jgi:hypothetical protein
LPEGGTVGLLLLLLHLALTAVPAVAATLYAMRLGVRNVAVLLAIALFGSGVVGLLGFWLFYADPTVGQTFSFFALFGSILLGAWSLRGADLDRDLLRRLAIPFGLWVAGSIFMVFFGFLHGGISEPLATGAQRFVGPLPSDSDIPLYFSEWFWAHGHAGTPPVFPGEWLASDRPPLQVGYVLTQRPFHWSDDGIDYQILGVVLQQLWIVGLWALLEAAQIGRRTRGLVMIAVLVSGLALVNGFFVWPKMLPAAFLLAAAALILTPLWSDLRRSLWGAALIAGLCGLAMMGHGASVFGVIPLALFALWRGLPSWRWIGVALAVGIVIMAPWSAYQNWGDPPGNRLTKWTLAGVIEIDPRGTGQAIREAYGEAGLGGALENKWENYETMLGSEAALQDVESAFEGNLTNAILAFRTMIFLFLLPSLTLLLLGPIAMAVLGWRHDRAGPEWQFALRCFGVVLIGCVCWGLLVFGGAEDLTVNHVGSYLLPILGMAGAIAGLRAVLPRFATWWVLLCSALSLALYTPSLLPGLANSYSVGGAILSGLAVAAYALIALGDPRSPGGRRSAQAKGDVSRGISRRRFGFE